MFKSRQVKRQAEPSEGLDFVSSESDRMFEQRLREAVAAGKFDLRYQSIVSVATGDIVAVEALLRWESEVGRAPAASFVRMLESTGLVKDLAPVVLTQACREARPWVLAHPGVRLTVNVSPQQLEKGFADSVLGTLSATRFPAERLCLELLPTNVVADPQAAWGELRQLKSAGVSVFLDDFGSLGSSIADLRRFNVDAIKIDPAFVSGLGESVEDEAVVVALIALAHALGMQTIAEGVETAIQLQRLQALGCDLAQGYHFMEPARAADLTARLASAAQEAV
jgi:EAL domain-containing protein (putative c-di-GMP-specific phosphodiesterase class I)